MEQVCSPYTPVPVGLPVSKRELMIIPTMLKECIASLFQFLWLWGHFRTGERDIAPGHNRIH